LEPKLYSEEANRGLGIPNMWLFLIPNNDASVPGHGHLTRGMLPQSWWTVIAPTVIAVSLDHHESLVAACREHCAAYAYEANHQEKETRKLKTARKTAGNNLFP